MRSNIFPVVLAGGSGTRLWPLSRKNFPKQFLCLEGNQSLIQQTLARALSLSLEEIFIVSNDAHYFLCQEQLQATHDTLLTYILEPLARNTAPAMAAAAEYLMEHQGPDAVMLVMPSDHLIKDTQTWQKAMLFAAQLAADNPMIISFGITPTGPETGYGYIQAGEPYAETYQEHQGLRLPVFKVDSFHEKPNSLRAGQMIEAGNYYWNSGMLACRVGLYLEELGRFAPDIVTSAKNAVAKGARHHDFIRLDEAVMSGCRSESNDYALMEHTQKALVLPLSLDWSDLGCWASVAEINDKDGAGNILRGNVIAKDSRNCLIRSEHPLVTTLGIQNAIIVATSDAVLVADKHYAQQVKDLVENIRLTHDHQGLLEDHPRVPRPWGHYEILAEGPSFKVKRLMVSPGCSLSLQIHQHRAEHWVVVAGTADIINGNQTLCLQVNQSTYIPKKTQHRLANSGDTPLYVIEVQSGDYLGEDDIQRLEDRYQRMVLT